MLPVPPALTNSSGPASASTRGDELGAPSTQFAARYGLHHADRRASQRPPRRAVADAGDLAFVRHHPDQPECRSAADLARERGGGSRIVQRRAPRADADPSAEQPQPCVGVDADLDRRMRPCAGGLDQVEVGDRVDHHRQPGCWRRPAGLADDERPRPARDLRERAAVDVRVADDEVVEAVSLEPQRLGDCQHEQPLALWPRQRPLEQSPATDRLARDPERRAGGSSRKRLGVGIERIEVDAGERRLELLAGALEPVAARRPRFAGEPPALGLFGRDRHRMH